MTTVLPATKRAVAPVIVSAALGLLLSGCGATATAPTSAGTTGGSSTAASSKTGSSTTTAQAKGGIGGNCTPTNASPTPAASAIPTASVDATTSSAVTAANALVSAMGSGSKLVVDNTLDGKRCSWSNFPDGLFNGRIGVKIGDMTAEQKAATLALLKAVLSADGYTQVLNQMAADDKAGGPGQQGTNYYHIVLFGQPSATTPWTISFGGHHLALHITLGGGVTSISPHFSGAQPIEYTNDAGQTIKTMGAEADAMFGLFTSLTDAQKKSATLAKAYDDIVMGPGTDSGYPTQEGLAYSELSAEQKAQVQTAIKGWVADMAPELADAYLALYTAQLDQTKIAFSGDLNRTAGTTYLRIDGPRLWIEWINTNATGFHYHTVYRDKLLDYGTGAA